VTQLYRTAACSIYPYFPQLRMDPQEPPIAISLLDIELGVTYSPAWVDALKRKPSSASCGAARVQSSSRLLSIRWAAYSGAATLIDGFPPWITAGPAWGT
jgi:hypothetical protein